MTDEPTKAGAGTTAPTLADLERAQAGMSSDRASVAAADAPLAAAGASNDAQGLGSGTIGDAELARLTDDIIAALKTVYDPEIPSDIYELGLIYKIDIADDRAVTLEMTLTTPNCPSAQELPSMVEDAVASVPGVREVKVDIVWDPPWDPSRMSDEARGVLNMW
jgi:FeS assembly SUF system protein